MHALSKHITGILELLGEDTQRPGLKATPERVAGSLQFLTKGYQENMQEILKGAIFECDSDEMVIVRNIELYSLCEHHLLPFFGKCHIGYLPKGRIIGLSKVARIVDVFARRLQIQEHLTKQIAHELRNSIGASGVGVVIEAQHLCMMMRGVEKQNSTMTTSVMLGAFREQLNTRQEFLQLIRS